MAQQKEGMRFYETIFIARQDIASNEVEKLTTHFEDKIKDLGGKIIKTEQWGLRTLAYKVNKSKKGHYVMINFEAPGTIIAELERRYRLHEDVIRYMTLTVESVSKDPSPILREENEAA